MKPAMRPSTPVFDYVDEDWMTGAACIGHDPAWWFWSEATSLATKHAAIAICNACPVRLACLEYATKTNSIYGVYGGLTENQRHELRKRKGNDDAA